MVHTYFIMAMLAVVPSPKTQFIETMQLGEACDEKIADQLWSRLDVDEPILTLTIESYCHTPKIWNERLLIYGDIMSRVSRKIIAHLLYQDLPRLARDQERRETLQDFSRSTSNLPDYAGVTPRYRPTDYAADYLAGRMMATVEIGVTDACRMLQTKPWNEGRFVVAKSRVSISGLQSMCNLRPLVDKVTARMSELGVAKK